MELYTGTWTSEKHTRLIGRGNAEVHMHPRSYHQKYESEVMLTYLGLYRMRQQQKMKVEILDNEIVCSEYAVPETKVEGTVIPAAMGQLKFHITKRTLSEMSGTYEFTNPADEGVFHLKKGEGHGEKSDCVLQ